MLFPQAAVKIDPRKFEMLFHSFVEKPVGNVHEAAVTASSVMFALHTAHDFSNGARRDEKSQISEKSNWLPAVVRFSTARKLTRSSECALGLFQLRFLIQNKNWIQLRN